MKNIESKAKFNRFIMVAISMISLFLFNIFYTNYKTSSIHKRYVMVDTDAISREFLSKIIVANLSDEKYKDLLITYDRTLTTVINKVSERNNFVILKKNAILTELPDLTNDVQNIVFTELKLDKLLN